MGAGGAGGTNGAARGAARGDPPDARGDLTGVYVWVWVARAGGRRLTQRVDGYRYTVCSGVVTWQDGEPTGAMPGKLVRGGRSAG